MKCPLKTLLYGKNNNFKIKFVKADLFHISRFSISSLTVLASIMTQFDQRKAMKRLIDAGTTGNISRKHWKTNEDLFEYNH